MDGNCLVTAISSNSASEDMYQASHTNTLLTFSHTRFHFTSLLLSYSSVRDAVHYSYLYKLFTKGCCLSFGPLISKPQQYEKSNYCLLKQSSKLFALT